MKRLIAAVLLVCLFSVCAASAAEWGEGTSPAQPYLRSIPVDLDAYIGYMMTYPTDKNPAELYCDTLYIYLPREDAALGSGSLAVADASGEITRVDFQDERLVRLYPLDEETLQDLLWGGGVGIEIRLPVSLKLGKDAWITMDEGCILAADGKVKSDAVKHNASDSWFPAVEGEFGVGKLFFSRADAPETPVLDPAAGDLVTFDLTLGGAAKTAVLVSENGSVACDLGNSFDANGTITFTLLSDDFQWSLLFVDGDGQLVDYLDFDRGMIDR